MTVSRAPPSNPRPPAQTSHDQRVLAAALDEEEEEEKEEEEEDIEIDAGSGYKIDQWPETMGLGGLGSIERNYVWIS